MEVECPGCISSFIVSDISLLDKIKKQSNEYRVTFKCFKCQHVWSHVVPDTVLLTSGYITKKNLYNNSMSAIKRFWYYLFGLSMVLILLLGLAYYLRNTILYYYPSLEPYYKEWHIDYNDMGVGLKFTQLFNAYKQENKSAYLLVSSKIINYGIETKQIPDVYLRIFNKNNQLVYDAIKPVKQDLAPQQYYYIEFKIDKKWRFHADHFSLDWHKMIVESKK